MSAVRPELISRAIGSIYEGSSDVSAWPRAIEQLRLLFQASQSCLTRFGPDIGADDVINPGLDADFQSRYIAEFADSRTEFAAAWRRAPTGEIFLDRALMGDDLQRSRFWNEWMAPQDMYRGIGTKVLTSGPSFWYLGVHRGRRQPGFEADDVGLMRLIASHLARATEIFHKFNSTRVLAAAHSALPFGVVIVDGGLRVHQINAAAERIIASDGSPLSLKQGVLSTVDRKTSLALQQLVANACTVQADVSPGRGGDLMVRSAHSDSVGEIGDNTRREIALSIAPLPAASLFPRAPLAAIHLCEVTLSLPDPFEDRVRHLFDLTPSEARLAAALAGGVSLKDAAIRQGIRFSTARSYLESIFRKTRTRQQSQLVALLKTTQPMIRSS